MSYYQHKIKEIIEKIGRNDFYLPAIQRKFVWDCQQIESFFDSIMRGYPIGTFLFWFVAGENKNNYTFYKFIQEYHERDRSRNEFESFLTIFGVLRRLWGYSLKLRLISKCYSFSKMVFNLVILFTITLFKVTGSASPKLFKK